MQLLGVSINLNLKIVMCSFPPFPFSLHFMPVLKWQDMFCGWWSPPSFTFMSSTFILFLPSVPPSLSVFVLSVNALDGGLSPGKHHYSNFLYNMNDGDPLFISDLLITPQPIAYPPRQGSHSHSRHYFIKRVRLRWAVMNNAVIMQVWCMQWLSSSSEKRAGCVPLLSRSKLPTSLLARKGQDASVKLYVEFPYTFCYFVEQRAENATYLEHLLYSEPLKTQVRVIL